MKTWEYFVFRIPQSEIDDVQNVLCQFGQKGWELVAVNLDLSFYFKREILE